MKPDEEVVSLINEIKEDQKGILNEVIGSTAIKLDGERNSVRGGHTNLGHLITAAMLSESKAEIALTNGGGIRASIDAGTITKGDVLSVLPFGNYIVTVKLTGQQIVDALNHGLVVGAGKFTHFAGMDVKVKEVVKSDVLQYEVISVTVDGKPLDLTKKYTVATNDFLSVGGDEYTMLADGELLNEFASLDEALISYIQLTGDEGINKANNTKTLTVVTEDSLTPEEPETQDTIAPEIKLNGAVPTTGTVGQEITLPSASARDNKDSEVTVTMIVADAQGNDVTLSNHKFTPQKTGNYTVLYQAQDKAGNKESRQYTIAVQDKNPNSNNNESNATQNPNSNQTGNTNNPQTGDDFNFISTLSLMGLSLAGLAIGLKKYLLKSK